MIQKLKDHISNNLNFFKKKKLLIAISGGLDSVVLTHLCKQLNLDFAIAHCNFNLRGNESNADEKFVIQLAEDLNIEAFIESFQTEEYANTQKLSIQMAARKLRYNWFSDLAKQLQFDYILTAHHADDNLETFLINLSRGTGLDGLTGILEINKNIVRPLLPFSREDIEEYAKRENLKWREDKSNASTKYLRNKLRLEVIPKLKETNPQLLQNFQKTQKHLQDTKQIVNDRLNTIEKKIVSVEKSVIKFNIKKLQKFSNPKTYVYELLKDYNFTEWNAIYDLLEAQSGKQVFSKTHRLIKDRKYLLLSNLNVSSSAVERFLIEENTKHLQTPFGTLFFETTKQLNNLNQSTIYVDKSKLNFPLTIRKWQKGDYFYPLGMTGKKKLSKYFKDEKLSLLDKENVWLLCLNNEIIWLINRRADNRFRVTKTTKQIIKITLK